MNNQATFDARHFKLRLRDIIANPSGSYTLADHDLKNQLVIDLLASTQ